MFEKCVFWCLNIVAFAIRNLMIIINLNNMYLSGSQLKTDLRLVLVGFVSDWLFSPPNLIHAIFSHVRRGLWH